MPDPTPPLRPWVAAALAGVAWGLAPPDGPGALLALAGAVAAAASITGRPAHDGARGAIVGLLWYGLQLRDIAPAWDRFAGEGGATALLAALPLQVLAPIGAWSIAGAAKRPWALALAMAAAEPLLSWVQPLPFGPALLLASAPALAWPAALGGRALLTAALLGWGALALRFPRAAMVALGLWVLPSAVPVVADGPTTRVAVIQPGTGAFDGRRSSTAEARAERLLATIGRVEADWVATPEGAWPFDAGEPEGARRAALERAFAGLPPVLLGASVGREPATNSLLVVDGGVRDQLDKARLVPVAERAIFGVGRDRFRPGDGSRVVEIAGIRVGALICYEDLWPSAIRRAGQEGADLLVAAANDAWVGPRAARWHLASARLAAIESGRWVLRPTANGTSAIVDPRGRIAWSAPWIDGDAHPDAPVAWTVAAVPLRRPLVSGSAVGPFVALAALAGLLAGKRR